MGFEVGDRVRCIRDSPDGNYNIKIGDLGTVCVADSSIGVRWDHNVGGGNCRGTCERGFGWYVFSSDIELYEEGEPVDIDEGSFMSMIGGSK